MKNYLLTLMFDGRSFHGWQVQKNAVTVQQCVQDGVQRILGVRENIIGCSRTDSGVHANMFCCNIRTEKNINLTSFRRSLNAVLPDSIAVTDITEVPYEFHARYNCKRKEYEYLLFNADYMNPFYVGRALYYPYSLDEKLINDNSKDFIGTHDFSAFCASGSSVEDKVRSVFSASFEKNAALNRARRFRIHGFKSAYTPRRRRDRSRTTEYGPARCRRSGLRAQPRRPPKTTGCASAAPTPMDPPRRSGRRR